jgi:AcrR family transcriptional regulator
MPRVTQGADMPNRPRNREKTREDLHSAMLRVQSKALKLSISAVAAEAGVHPSLIHNTYPDIAEGIRAHVGRATRQQRDAKAIQLAEAKASLKESRAELDRARNQIAMLASINETLREELATLKAGASGKVVILTPHHGG